MPRVLIVDDEPGIRFGMRDFLENEGLEVEEADTIAAAERLVRESGPDAVVLDHMLPDGTALDLLPRIKDGAARHRPDRPRDDRPRRAGGEGGRGSVPRSRSSCRRSSSCCSGCSRASARSGVRRRPRTPGSRDGRPVHRSSPAIRALAEEARRLTASSSPILIEGETGTGKGVLAAGCTRNGPRGDEPFVDLNCAGLSREFLETELFGHEKGAYTGAVAAKPGLLDHRGVVFLDEIGDIDPHVQPKLLKVLEEKRFRLGEVRDRQVDVQLIAATHQNLHQLVEEKRFRSDLYFRISTIPLRVPPLRERPHDVPVLARLLLDGFAADLSSRRGTRLLPAAERALSGYSWRGNVRELRNVLERALLLVRPRRARAGGPAVRRARRHADAGRGVPPPIDRQRRVHAGGARAHAHRARPARAARPGRRGLASVGIPRSTLYQKIKKFGLPLPRAWSRDVRFLEPRPESISRTRDSPGDGRSNPNGWVQLLPGAAAGKPRAEVHGRSDRRRARADRPTPRRRR